MEKRSHAIVAGLFTVVFVAALAAAVSWFSDRGRGPRDVYVIVAKRSVSGLNEQAPVRYRGVEVGRVTRIAFDPADPRAILVRIAVDSSTHVTAATYAELGYQGVTGLAYVALDDDGRLGDPLPTSSAKPARIEMRPSLLQEVGDAGQLLLLRVSEIADRLNTILSEGNQANMTRTLANIEQMTGRFATFQDKLLPLMDSLPRFTQEASGVMTRTDELLVELRGLTETVEKELANLATVSRSAEKVGVTVDAFYDTTLPDLNRLVERLARSAESLDRVLRAQSDQPRSLLFGMEPPAPGPGEPGFGEPGRTKSSRD